MTLHVHFDHPFEHPILAAVGCPPSGNGALIYLQHLTSSLERCLTLKMGASAEDWLRTARQLSKSIIAHPSSPAPSPSAAELVNQPWGAMHDCIATRRDATARGTGLLDVVLVHMVLEAVVGHRPLKTTGLQGLKYCYSALKGSRKLHPDWMRLCGPDIIVKAKLTELVNDLTHPPARQFGMLVLSLIDNPLPTTAGVSEPLLTTTKLEQRAEPQFEKNADGRATNDCLEDSEREVPEELESPSNEQHKFQRGDSVLEWQRNRVRNAGRNDSLGLESWTSMPVEHTCEISARLPALLADAGSPWHRPAIVATAALLTSTPPHVLLHAPVNREGELNIDIENQQFSWPIELLRDPSYDPANTNAKTLICVPFPVTFGQTLTDLSHTVGQGGLRYFSDLFQIEAHSAAWSALNRQTYDLLKDLSDPAFPAFPGRWSNSISRVYMEACSSDLMTAACSLDLSITPQAALYYFHPSAADTHATVQKVYARLGLGPIVSDSACSSERSIPTDDALLAGFSAMDTRSHQLITATQNKRTNIHTSIQHLNELTQLVAAMTVFLIGGRGSKVEEITCGALYCSNDSMWIEDKKVAHENSSRILPKPQYLRSKLHELLLARQAVAEKLAEQLSRDRSERWKELAAGQLRFDASAFELLEFKSDHVKRSPVTASHIESVSQKYFGAPKNFMRHVLITHWACDGEDHNLLRLITGHSTAGLAVPAAGATYTPASSMKEAGSVLEKLLQQWLPTQDNTASIQGDYRFVSLPGRSILKVVGSCRSHIEKWDAPIFTRWHLASIRIMERVRHLLLNGHAPDSPYASLWLHLVCFDAIHHPSDIESIFKHIDTSFELGNLGWIVKFSRHGSPHLLAAPLQVPTALLLQSVLPFDARQHQPYELVIHSVQSWLHQSMLDCWGEPFGAERALLAAAALWSDWHIPAAIQCCFHQDSHAPVLDAHSNREILGIALQTTEKRMPQKPKAKARKGDAFDQFYKILNRLGSNRHRFGEQKKRAQLFERWLKLVKFPDAGELAALLAQVVVVNITRLRAAKKTAIEFSSIRTYFSSLRPYLELVKHLDVIEFDALEWLDFSRDLMSYASSSDREKSTAMEAALWLMGCVRELGYPLPSNKEIETPQRHPQATAPTSIATISQRQLIQVTAMLSSNNESPLRQQRLQLALSLLNTLPLRWGELAAMNCTDFTLDGTVCITTSGYSHLKSYAARRRLRLTAEQLLAVQSVLQQINAMRSRQQTDSLVFGSRRRADDVDSVDSGWIADLVTEVIQSVTSNPNFRVHSFRAGVVSQRLVPDWDAALPAISEGTLGPKEARTMFDYNHQRAWAIDRVRIEAGHASIRTTLSYYFHAWLPARFIAVASIFAEAKPTDLLLTRSGVSRSALIKACTRNVSLREDPWLYLLKKAPKKASDPIDFHTDLPDQEPDRNTVSLQPEQVTALPNIVEPRITNPTAVGSENMVKEVTYVGLRLLGMRQVDALNHVSLSKRQADQYLERRVALSTLPPEALRGRVKGALDGRAFQADVRLLRSSEAIDLCLVLSRMPIPGLRVLLQLLIPGHVVLNWDTEIEEVARWLEKSNISLEVVSDIKRVDLEINHRLGGSDSIIVGSPAHDIGFLPRIFVQPRNPAARNTVTKARWTTLVRVLCETLLVFSADLAVA